MPTWEEQNAEERAKIDNFATDGLAGVSNSLAYRVHETERHLHHYNHFFGAAASANGEIHVADHLVTTPFQANAGNTVFGSWLQVLGSSDTPHIAGTVFFDLHELFVTSIQRANTIYLVQIGFGASGTAALNDDDVTETMYIAPANARSSPMEVNSERVASGTKTWLRILADGANEGTMDFFIGLHEYEG